MPPCRVGRFVSASLGMTPSSSELLEHILTTALVATANNFLLPYALAGRLPSAEDINSFIESTRASRFSDDAARSKLRMILADALIETGKIKGRT